jgi:hypothetical protein
VGTFALGADLHGCNEREVQQLCPGSEAIHDTTSPTPTGEANQSSSSIGLFLVIAGVLAAFLFAVYRAQARTKKAIQIIAREIDAQSSALRVKRIQTVIPDHYGTKNYSE